MHLPLSMSKGFIEVKVQNEQNVGVILWLSVSLPKASDVFFSQILVLC